MATEKATVAMVTSPQHSSVECQTEEHRRVLHREAQRRYRQARSVRQTAEEKRERLIAILRHSYIEKSLKYNFTRK